MEKKFNFELINSNDYEYILNSIDSTILKKVFLETCKKMDVKSKYYIGNKGNGKYWNGFRPNSISSKKIIKSIVDAAKKDSKEIDYKLFLESVVENKFHIKESSIDEVKEKILKTNNINAIESLFKLMAINDISDDKIEIIKINNLKRDYDTKIAEIEKNLNEKYNYRENYLKKENQKLAKELENSQKNHNVRLEELNKKIDELKQENSRLLVSFKMKEEELNNIMKLLEKNKKSEKIMSNINELFNCVIGEKLRKKVVDYLLEEKYETKEEIKKGMINIINILTDSVECKNFNELIIELYVLNKILEG